MGGQPVNIYQRETIDLVSVTTKDYDTVITDNLMYAVVPMGQRPGDVADPWVAPVVLDGRSGVLVQGLPPGVYSVFVQVTSSPLVPVEPAGQFQVV